MFAPSFSFQPSARGRASADMPSHLGGRPRAGAVLRLAFLILPLAAAPQKTASAQALGTMQVTARVLPGGPAWAGLSEAQALVEQMDPASRTGPTVRQAGLVSARADLKPGPGWRRLLITVDYIRN